MRTNERAALALATSQHGVLTTAQTAGLGLDDALVDRRIADGRWQRVHRGVYVVHGGPLPWLTRAQAALLHCGPDAALSHDSAAWLHGLLPRAPERLEVCLPHSRRMASGAGLAVHRTRAAPSVVGSPRRVAVVPTVVDLLARSASDDATVALLGEAARRGVALGAVLQEVSRRTTMPGRSLALELLATVGGGIESALELRYHRHVERRHGLPRSQLQVRHTVGGAAIRADCRYIEWAVRVELDGAMAHSGARGDRDVWRDNAVLIELGEITLRYRWRHVLDPCRTAAQVAAALQARGWPGRPRACGPHCPGVRPR